MLCEAIYKVALVHLIAYMPKFPLIKRTLDIKKNQGNPTFNQKVETFATILDRLGNNLAEMVPQIGANCQATFDDKETKASL